MPEDSNAPLPLELVLKVFNVAASSSSQSCYNLCLVSSWARHIALPHLFTTIIIKNQVAIEPFFEQIATRPRDPPNAEFLPAPQVRNLWMMTESPLPGRIGIVQISRACVNLTNIAMTTSIFHELARSTKGLGPGPRRPVRVSAGAVPLHVQRPTPFPGAPTLPFATVAPLPAAPPPALAHSYFLETPRPDAKLSILLLDIKQHWEGAMVVERHLGGSPRLFRHITHLRLDKQPIWGLHLGYFGRLTHFAVPYTNPEHPLLPSLETRIHGNRGLPPLQAVVVVLWTDIVKSELVQEVQGWVARMRAVNDSAYVVESISTGLQEEWEDEAGGGLSIWDRAVIFTNSLDRR